MYFRVNSKGHGTEWGYFWVAIIINIVFLVLEIPDIFWGEG